MPCKIEIDGKLYARRSDMIEYLHVAAYRIPPYSPIYESISDFCTGDSTNADSILGIGWY